VREVGHEQRIVTSCTGNEI